MGRQSKSCARDYVCRICAVRVLGHTRMMHAEATSTVLMRPRGFALRAQGMAFALVVGLLCNIFPACAQDGAPDHRSWPAGAYSFSDELGGFRITSVTGRGTRDDPVVIAEELTSASPVTLVIRTIKPIRAFDFSGDYANGFLTVRLEILNNSRLAWVEFEFELQEILHEPSLFGDGLSFDQRRTDARTISSDRFLQFSRDFEPYDRLLLRDGKVDPGETAAFGFLITDFTPKRQFYLVQDPRIPST